MRYSTQCLHALDLASGAELCGSPASIQATYPSKAGQMTFDQDRYAERAGLVLLDGTLYLSWTSHCDQQTYTGWVIGYNPSTLHQVSVIDITPNDNEGAIWMAGGGPAADEAGNIYFLSANGSTNGIVRAVENRSGGLLHAYDATDLSRELYNSTQAGSRDQFSNNKFIMPMIANGKVYVGTPTGVIVFGLLP